jgi:hypothetical protein
VKVEEGTWRHIERVVVVLAGEDFVGGVVDRAPYLGVTGPANPAPPWVGRFASVRPRSQCPPAMLSRKRWRWSRRANALPHATQLASRTVGQGERLTSRA